ncbi:MAG: hypothetical protein LAO20_05665 [Acidobacteriia bacterium]|nr:hypothetical protein [Terriglobia bacterium]
MLPLARHQAVSRRQDRLMRELGRHEAHLQAWISQSAKNARWFRKDPIGAMRAAGLNIDDDLMCELERITAGIARKLK